MAGGQTVSLFAKRLQGPTADQLIPPRPGYRSGVAVVTNDTALRASAVWACLRLRANLVSTMPVDLFRKVNGVQVEVPKPKVLVNPGGDRVDISEWLYSTQFDLDRAGNCFGLITERDGLGFPSRIDLLPLGDVSVIVEQGELAAYRIAGKRTAVESVWHEKQYTVAGLHVGLSPIAYAAWAIGEYLSIQEFALEWFGNQTVPAGHLRNINAEVSRDQAIEMKQRFQTTVRSGQAFVSGKDWEYMPLNGANQSTDWLEGKKYGVGDIARFFDCPGDLIDAAVSTGNITYANVTQRNLQFLITSLGAAVIRREMALSTLTSKPRFVKLNTDALLRMDRLTRSEMLNAKVIARVLAPSEARALDNLPPFTEEQMGEFDRLYWTRRLTVTSPPGPQMPPLPPGVPLPPPLEPTAPTPPADGSNP